MQFVEKLFFWNLGKYSSEVFLREPLGEFSYFFTDLGFACSLNLTCVGSEYHHRQMERKSNLYSKLQSDVYSELCQLSKMKVFIKLVNDFISIPPENIKKPLVFRECWNEVVDYFHKKLHLRCLTGFWIRLWTIPRKPEADIAGVP